MAKLSDINRVREDPVEMPSTDETAARCFARANHANRQANVLGIESRLQPHHAADFEVATEESANELGGRFDNMESAVFDPVSKGDCAAHPDSPFLRCGDFVPDALARNLTLELRKRKQHVEGQPPHAGRGIEGLGYRDERDVVFVKELDELGEVSERPCQPIDLIDDDHIDLSSANVVQQF